MDWHNLRNQLHPDGSLRDIYVLDAGEQVWGRFLAALPGSMFRYRLRHGDRPLPRLFAQFAEAATLSKTDSVLLEIELSPTLKLNCHFFTVEEIELDVSPRDLPDADAMGRLVEFMKWLARVIARPVLLTHENTPDQIILRVEN